MCVIADFVAEVDDNDSFFALEQVAPTDSIASDLVDFAEDIRKRVDDIGVYTTVLLHFCEHICKINSIAFVF